MGLLSVAVIRSSGHAATLGLAALVVTSFIAGEGWPVAAGAAGLSALVFGRHLVVGAVRGLRAEKPRDG